MPYLPLPPAFTALAGLVLGLALGSFYNVCIHRYPAGMSIVTPPSHCPGCGYRLAWWDNIPLVSFLFLRGRCRKCSRPIGWRYPAVEALSGLLSMALALQFGLGVVYVAYLFFFGLLTVASFIDLDSFILPDIITLPGALLALAASSLILPVGWESALTGALVGAGIFWALQQGYKMLRGVEGLGTGDIKLMLLIGALVGWQGLPIVILLASVSGLMISIVYLARDRSRGLRTRIPFGPFLSLGTVLYILWGSKIWALYLVLVGA